MFEDYSQRSIKVIFIARLRAGKRGAGALELDDLLSALIVEDQGGELAEPFVGIPLSNEYATSVESVVSSPHARFFPADVAVELLSNLDKLRALAKAVPPATDIRVSDQLRLTLDKARDIKEGVHKEHVEPLHLLAAALSDESIQVTPLFRSRGITPEKVLDAIKGEAT